jgi:monoamine oxidase
MDYLEADVCVVGAGFAGMSAAWRLHQAGLTVVVLEARERVGGRTWTVYLDDGTHIDRGGAWFGPGQDRSYALAEEMGRTTYRQYAEGENVFVNNGRPIRYAGTVPVRMNPLALASVGIAMKRIDRMSREVPLDKPWEANRAPDWDSQTVAGWINAHVHQGTARTLVEEIMTEVSTCDLREVSLLGALHLIRSNNGIDDLLSAEGGHQQDRVVGGSTSILHEMHDRLGDAVRLRTAVHAIKWTSDSVTVGSSGARVSARAAVVAVPPWLSQRIWWDPPLPRARAQLIQRMPVGQMFKIHLVYEKPFWRDDGLSGQTLDPASIVPLTIDACGPEPPPGVLCVLSDGRRAYELGKLSPEQRRGAVTDAIVERFGPAAAAPVDYIEQDWTAENWTGGAMITHFPPGVLTSFGEALRPPVGPLHWASTEHSDVMLGCIDGAIRSGERAAHDVLDGVSRGSTSTS